MSQISREIAKPETERPQSRLRRYAPLILWMAAIFFASTDELSGSKTSLVIEPFLRWFFPHITSHRVELIHLLVRKGAHFSEYAILGLLAARAFSTSNHSFLRLRWFVASLVLVSIYALSDEYHQSFVPSRTASVYDSMIDIAGGLTVLVLLTVGRKRGDRKQNRPAASDSPLSRIEN